MPSSCCCIRRMTPLGMALNAGSASSASSSSSAFQLSWRSSTLASVGISFVAFGLFAFVVGVLEATGIFPWPHLSDVPPVVAIFLVGPAMVVVGAVALVALRFYVRFVVRAVRTALVPVRTVSGPNDYR